MKSILLLLLTPCFVFSQPYLGQTKSYIIKSNATLQIETNTDEILVLNNNALKQFYWFDKRKDYLCEIMGLEMLVVDAEEVWRELVKNQKYEMAYDAPLLTVCGKGKSIQAVVYSNSGSITYYYFSDMCGSTDRGIRYIQIETKKE